MAGGAQQALPRAVSRQSAPIGSSRHDDIKNIAGATLSVEAAAVP